MDALVDGVLGAEEYHLALRDVDAAEQAGLLTVPRKRRLASACRSSVSELWSWISGAVLIWISKFRPPRMPVCADGVRTGSADFAIIGAEVRLQIEAGAQNGDRARAACCGRVCRSG